MKVAPGKRATKKILPDRVLEYDAGMWFRVRTVRVDGLRRLAHVVHQLEAAPKWFAIRGHLIEGKDPSFVRRTKCGANPNFEPRPRRHVALDFDDVELGPGGDPTDVFEVAFAAINLLPDEFQAAACHAALSSGAGIKPGGRVRLWYWLSRPLTGAELKRWLHDVPHLDTATLEDIQPIYVASPIVEPGAVDPLGGKPRSATLWMGEFLEDLEPTVLVPDPLPEPQPRQGDDEGERGTPGVNVTIPAMATAHDAGQYVASLLWRLRDQPSGRGRAMFTAVAMKIYAVCMIFDLDPGPPIAAMKGVMRDRGWSPDETTRAPHTFGDLNRQLEWARKMAGEVEVRT